MDRLWPARSELTGADGEPVFDFASLARQAAQARRDRQLEILIFAALAEAIWTSSLSVRDRLPAARRVDRSSRYAFPVVYGALTIWCFA